MAKRFAHLVGSIIEIKQILDLITPQDYNLNLSLLIRKIPLQGSTFVKVV